MKDRGEREREKEKVKLIEKNKRKTFLLWGYFLYMRESTKVIPLYGKKIKRREKEDKFCDFQSLKLQTFCAQARLVA